MSHRVGSKGEPVIQLQLRPGGLEEKYPAFLQPSPMLVRCLRISRAVETAVLALTARVKEFSRMSYRAFNESRRRLAPGERIRRHSFLLAGWLSRGFKTLSDGLVTVGFLGLRVSRQGLQRLVSLLGSKLRRARRSAAADISALSVTGYGLEQGSPKGLWPREQALCRELTRFRARLVEELLAEEEELARVAARVARLQHLIRAQEQLLVEMTMGGDDAADGSGLADSSAGQLVGAGKVAGRDKVRTMPLFRQV